MVEPTNIYLDIIAAVGGELTFGLYFLVPESLNKSGEGCYCFARNDAGIVTQSYPITSKDYLQNTEKSTDKQTATSYTVVLCPICVY